MIEHAEPTLRGNKIHHQRMGGLWVYKEGRGLYEGNEIYANAKAGIRIWSLGDPTIKQNKIHSGRACGVLIYECGKVREEEAGRGRMLPPALAAARSLCFQNLFPLRLLLLNVSVPDPPHPPRILHLPAAATPGPLCG